MQTFSTVALICNHLQPVNSSSSECRAKAEVNGIVNFLGGLGRHVSQLRLPITNRWAIQAGGLVLCAGTADAKVTPRFPGVPPHNGSALTLRSSAASHSARNASLQNKPPNWVRLRIHGDLR